MKFSFTNNPESEFFITNPNLKQIWWMGGGRGVARVRDFYQKNTSLKKECFFFFFFFWLFRG